MPESPVIYKTGYLVSRAKDGGSEGQSGPGKSYYFVMSSESKDSYGDIVKQNWDLTQFKKNPIGLWRHSTAFPIGTWSGVRVKDGVLQGTFTFAAPGTTECVDEVAALVEQNIVRMVSVGFVSRKPTPIDPEHPWDGYILDDNSLRECSIVPLGACDDAMMQNHVKTANALVRKALLSRSDGEPEPGSAYNHIKSQASGTPPKPNTLPRSNVMSLADKIKAKQQEIVRIKDQIAEITNALDDTGAMNDEQSEALADLTANLERHSAHLRTLEDVERVQASSSGGAGSAQPERTEPAPLIHSRSRTPATMRATNALACVVKALASNTDPVALAEREFRDAPEIAHLVRAATAPATSGGATWAANLIQETWGPLVELMYGLTIYGRVPGLRLTFDGKINLPVQNGRGNLAGDFVAENGVIPVKAGSIGTTSLQPHALAVISAFSKELMRRSIPSIQGIIQQQILADTAATIDTKFLDAVARTAGTRPAGLRDATETGSSNINACTNVATGAGNATVKEILTDTRALLARVWAINGTGGVWLMNPAQRLSLEDKQDGTTGHFPFREEIQGGKFRGFPVIESTNVTAAIVAFVSGDSMAFGSELMPYFEQSDQATLHFEGASPLAIGTAGTPNTVAAPTISLFQQNLVAVKGIWTLDWRITRQAGVQVLTGADAW